MGYTRYWTRTEKQMDDDFVEFCNKVLDTCKDLGIRIRNWDGEGEPTISTDLVSLNGNGDDCLDHESFVLDNNTGFNFCKTARKPYDYAVRTILMEALRRGFVTDVEDDGINEEIISDEKYIKRG